DGFRTDEEVREFMEANGVERRYDSIESLAENVDIGFIHSCNWDKHLAQAMPFIKAGKAVFLDKPIVGNLKDCLQLEKLADEGALILGSSASRYCDQIREFAEIPTEERGEIISITGLCGVDDFGYGIHAIEAMSGITGPGIVSACFRSRISLNEINSDQYILERGDGITMVLHLMSGVWLPQAFTVTTTKSVYTIQPDLFNVYPPMLEAVCDQLENRKKMASVAEMTENVKAHLAAKKSRENGGEVVILSELEPDETGFDGNRYEEEYIATVRSRK
ncbi:MAG: Gfo/Idh/MocA family oxidoreductase, partial [Deltaproteobacteria bacterium]|nr:Gfo/Idh/MocA family oxidoreductase [Deltaproteobacteria bacterium]